MLAQFCIRIVDKSDPVKNPDQFRLLTQAGDVIEIQPKGFCWGKGDLASPDHVIVELEVESVEKARLDYMAGEQFDKEKNPFPLRRKVKLDLAQLPAKVKGSILSKDPEAVKAEYQTLKDAGKPPIFGEDKQTAFKIPSVPEFDPWTIRVVKPDPAPNPFVVGDDPFEVR